MKTNTTVRVKSVEIQNFKNTRYGRLTFENPNKSYRSSILGLYGQNGSGKTALIDAFSLLKYVLTGHAIPPSFADYIHVEAESSTLSFVFEIAKQAKQAKQTERDTDGVYTVRYTCCLRRDTAESTRNTTLPDSVSPGTKVTLFHETLSYSYRDAKTKSPLHPLMDARNAEVFAPKSQFRALVGGDKNVKTELMFDKKLALASSRSFLFSKEMLGAVRRNAQSQSQRQTEGVQANHEPAGLTILESLVRFGNFELFIIHTASPGALNMNVLPLRCTGDEHGASSMLLLQMNGPTLVPQSSLEAAKKGVDNLNIVLTQLVPGLTIGVRELGRELDREGGAAVKIQLVSCKNKKEIPLQYESEGIKKIISILHLLTVVYNQPSITVAVDELDAGVFEYLLGELLRIISENGRGQLIFTSHNLRPLETLDRGFVAFTTTNPDNRYIRFSNVRTNHNLRDFYYRDILLGEQIESVYEPTNNYEIALAFREVGERSGS